MLLPCLVFLYLQLKLSSIWLFIQSHLPKIFALHIIVLGNSIRVFMSYVLLTPFLFPFLFTLHSALGMSITTYYSLRGQSIYLKWFMVLFILTILTQEYTHVILSFLVCHVCCQQNNFHST